MKAILAIVCALRGHKRSRRLARADRSGTVLSKCRWCGTPMRRGFSGWTVDSHTG
jgi:hypothetical protein